ncbi:uncharacterized protein cubi_02335 [Cryptosporidium ubiquitum]|uniref:Uncharacterized protein n=1 Tax=Cryptosporidium ubiquitum TaxID=857276 RepID=A0A1J4MFV3_9CRYT|nr:uncharacterized protein cubi_02335 [Cryptosporidium ubiquitum]OII73104.1 hypothetical protein cubi_02335 [Cryptosporidium ubiquitum]
MQVLQRETIIGFRLAMGQSMNTIFLPETPKEQKGNNLELINLVSENAIEKNFSLTEETNLLLKIQNTESEIFKEHLDYIESDNQFLLNDCLKGTPIRKRCDKERSFTQSNKLLITPKKYFGEDILNTVPKNMGRFVNSLERLSIDKKNNITLSNTPQKKEMRYSMIKLKPSIFNNQNKFCQTESSCPHISVRLAKESSKKWFLNFFNTIYEFLIYQLPLALIFYSFALFLISGL